MLRPPYWPGRNSPAHDGSRLVLLDLARSADPPMNHGIFLAIAFSVLPELSRVPMPLASAGKVGMSLSQPVGSSRACILARLAARSGNCLAYASKSFVQADLRSLPRLPTPFLKSS